MLSSLFYIEAYKSRKRQCAVDDHKKTQSFLRGFALCIFFSKRECGVTLNSGIDFVVMAQLSYQMYSKTITEIINDGTDINCYQVYVTPTTLEILVEMFGEFNKA
jgi:hypothetical protein